MPDVVIAADTFRSPDMRHEVPIGVPDPFLYVEHDGQKHVVAPAMEIVRVREAAPDIETHPLEEFGIDSLYTQGLTVEQIALEVLLRACRAIGVEEAVVPAAFPLREADHLRANGIEIRTDQAYFDSRRRAKNESELAGIRRAQRAAEAGMRVGSELLRRAAPQNGGLVVDGEPLTVELIKMHVERAFGEHGAAAEEFIVSHGPQTAVGHDMGSGRIAPGEAVVFDLFPRDRESGCYADMTRSFVVGEAPEELREYHRLSREALDRALEMIGPGVNGGDVHARVCELFHEHGYPTQLHKAEGEVLESGYYHATGHGVGLEVHERPYIGRRGDDFVPGDVVAIEPGLYRAGFGGVRLEDIVLVTEDGAEVLTDYPYDLEP
jgi:Xaa-Pro aminopeptidase